MSPRRTDRTVSPRLVWGGLAVALAGAVVVSVGIIIVSVLVSVAGAVVLLLGGAVAVRGGVMLDARVGLTPREEIGHLASGESLPPTVPGQMTDDPDVQESAARTAAMTRRLERRSEGRRWPPLLPAAGVFMLLVAVALVFTPWHLLRYGVDRTDSGIHTGAAIVLALAGIACLAARGLHRICGAAAALAGLGLALEAFLGHALGDLTALEVALAAVALAAGAVALLARR